LDMGLREPALEGRDRGIEDLGSEWNGGKNDARQHVAVRAHPSGPPKARQARHAALAGGARATGRGFATSVPPQRGQSATSRPVSRRRCSRHGLGLDNGSGVPSRARAWARRAPDA
jgi:hypothetical protein